MSEKNVRSSSIINMLSGGAGYIIPMLLNLISTPILIRHLGSATYGIQNLVNVIIGYLMLADMGLDIPITKYVAEFKAKHNRDGLNNLLNTTLVIYLIIGVVGMIVLFCLAGTLSDHVFKVPPEFRKSANIVFFISGIGFFGGILNMWGRAIFNGLQRYDISNSISITSNILSIIIGIVLVKMGYGVIEFVLVKIISMLASGIVYFFLTRRFLPEFAFNIRVHIPTWDVLKTQIGYGFFLRISGILFARMDQTLLGVIIGISAVGIYSIPYLITSSLIALLASITHFIFPLASTLHSTNKTEELNNLFLKGTRLVSVLSCILFVPLLLFGHQFLVLWVGKDIGDQGAKVLILLGLATFSCSLTNIVVNVLIIGIGHLKTFTIYATLRGVVMAAGCAIFINLWGIKGAGAAMMLTCLADYILFYIVLKRYLKLSIKQVISQSYLYPLLLAAVLIPCGYLLQPFASTWTGLCLVCGSFVIVYLALAYFFSIFKASEKEMAKSLLRVSYIRLKNMSILTKGKTA